MHNSDTTQSQNLQKNPLPDSDSKERINQSIKFPDDLKNSGNPPATPPSASPAPIVTDPVPSTTPPSNISQDQDLASASFTHIGRFLIQKELGKGAYGTVYRCKDEKLKRIVAIKVPHPEYLNLPGFREEYLKEAQVLAQMKHPSIVEVLEIGDNPFFLVSSFVDGTNLETKIKQERMSFVDVAHLIEVVADGLQHAHSKGVVHRDLKPANILIDKAGKPYIADFGMALHDDDFGRGVRRTGTPLYNSPEQARSEGHRVDGRSDIFSLGIILYELLTGSHPFLRGKPTKEELFRAIIHDEPKPPQQFDEFIPKPLVGICLQCLAKEPKERFQSGHELAEALRNYMVTAGTSAELSGQTLPATARSFTASTLIFKTPISDLDQIRVVPKGLRSFDEDDSYFFLAMLPGVRGVDDLPESVRYWKTRIERAGESFSVGLIYGPSGCGKSSLVRAGILPLLDKAKVASVYVEAAPDQTESRFLTALRKLAPNLPEDVTLKDAAIAIRKGRAGVARGKKVMIVLDQFEQWLHERQGAFSGNLADALRQFDGEQAQCILLVRDDFSMPIARFMKELQIDLVPDNNYQVVDLFDRTHATKVLQALGRAYGQIPEFPAEPTPAQKEFLKLAVDGLSQENRVISVRLALFAQMMKSRPWTPKSLNEVGGIEGLGIAFLEETFTGKSASPEYCFHQKAVRRILRALLPEGGADIKGQMRSREELQRDSGYGHHPRDFEALLRILDREVRLLTPTDTEGKEDPEVAASADARANLTVPENRQPKEVGTTLYYQVTHDYLVPSIRDWLRRKQRESAKGRAEILLEERAALWRDKKQSRHLPSLPEYLRIAWYTKPFEWTQVQKEMVGQSCWFHGARSLAIVLLAGLLSFGTYEGYQRFTALKLVDTLANAEPAQIENLVKQIESYATWADGRLESIRQTQPGTTQSFAATLALLPRRPELAQDLAEQLTSLNNERFRVAVYGLKVLADDSIKERLWAGALEEKNLDKRFRVWAAMAVLDPGGPKWNEALDFVAGHLIKLDATNYLFWRELLAPVGGKLIPSLAKRFRDVKAPEQVRSFAGEAVISYGKNQPVEVFGLMLDAPALFYPNLQKACLDQTDSCSKLAAEEIGKPIPDNRSEDEKDAQAMRKANAAIFLLKANQADQKLWDLWKLGPDPRIRSEVIHDCPLLDLDPSILIQRLEQKPEISTCRALVLSLGSYAEGKVAAGEKTRLIDVFLKEFATHPDGGYHSALEWTLRKWGQEKRVDAILQDLAGKYPKNTNEEKEWLVTPHGITMMVIPCGSFAMGSPETETGHEKDERLRTVKISRPFLLANHEITRRIFRQFEKEIKRPLLYNSEDLLVYSKTDIDPQTGVDWYDAARFCNWLSEKEGIPRDQWCYEPANKAGGVFGLLQTDLTGGYREGMSIKSNHRDLAGYRLPLESEWEYACRARTETSRYYGNRLDLLGQYACYLDNSANHLLPVQSLKPSDWGLFGMLGNAFEWCSDSQNQTNEGEMERILLKDNRSLRGGSFIYRALITRSACRFVSQPNDRYLINGFRPSRTYDLRFLQPHNK